MATIIKSKHALPAEPVIYRFDDVAADARQIVENAKADAVAIVAEARSQADEVRRQAEQAGRDDALAAAKAASEAELQLQLHSLLPAITSAVQQLTEARQAWQREWQRNAIALSVKIAERIIRREVKQTPSITLAYVREALEMCAAAPQVRVLLHPDDAQSLGESAQQIVREIMPAARAEIVAADSIFRGGCRIETRHGEIDQQIETQLRRIESELRGNE
jgi:flagellar assembly protein FliH